MKKILFYINSAFTVGGLQRISINIANKLAETANYDVEILSLFKADNDKPVFDIDARIKTSHFFENRVTVKRNFFKIIFYLRRFLKQNQYDLIVVSGSGMSLLFYLAQIGLKEKSKCVAWEHSNFNHGKKFGLEWWGKRIACSKFSGLVVITKASLNRYLTKIKNINKIEQIYNPIEDFSSPYHYNADSKKIISCGRFSRQKGFDILIDVAKIIFEKHPDWSWDIWGDGAQRSLLEAKIAGCKLQNNLFLKGFSTNIMFEYHNYSFFVLTSRYEGFGLVLTEAQLNNLPCISFDCDSGPNEIILDNENGYIIPCFDVKKMAEKICDLIENKDRRVKFSQNAQNNLHELQIDNIMQKWEKLIADITSEKP